MKQKQNKMSRKIRMRKVQTQNRQGQPPYFEVFLQSQPGKTHLSEQIHNTHFLTPPDGTHWKEYSPVTIRATHITADHHYKRSKQIWKQTIQENKQHQGANIKQIWSASLLRPVSLQSQLGNTHLHQQNTILTF